MKQDYDQYTGEDQLVWKTLYNRQIGQIADFASAAYIRGMQQCGFEADSIPRITELNTRLLAATGWSIAIVPGLIDNHAFFRLLSEKKFPASTWLRKMELLDYLEEPDMFHDILGHIPLLVNPDFCAFLAALATTALDWIEDDYAIELISRIYWYSVEFGLIIEKDELKIYGAGILSSKGETHYAIHDDRPQRLPFTVAGILRTPYIKDKFQEQYFIIRSYRELTDCLQGLGAALREEKNSLRPIF